jgi:Arc/MetJ-type ribon-helix-helix transcriptional regulator
MGRPPLRVKATTVRLPNGISERIDGLVGSNRRAEFIRSAVMKELRRREAARQKRSTKADQ